ncbi:unnamed protein product, partial [Didymodactylos carnosus]
MASQRNRAPYGSVQDQVGPDHNPFGLT